MVIAHFWRGAQHNEDIDMCTKVPEPSPTMNNVEGNSISLGFQSYPKEVCMYQVCCQIKCVNNRY